jgi:hypothetical protein
MDPKHHVRAKLCSKTAFAAWAAAAALAGAACSGSQADPWKAQSNAQPDTSTPDGGPPATSALSAFQSSFYAFATTNCSQCHASAQQPYFASTDVMTAYDAAKPLASFGNPANSILAQFAGNSHCGIAADCGSNTPAVITALGTWGAAEASAATAPTTTTPLVIVNDLRALQAVAADLQAQPATSQKYMRYFTLAAWGNLAGTPPVTLDTERGALVKMINLCSTGPAIVQPAAIDDAKLIFRVDMRTLNWTAAAWTNLKVTDPYFVPAHFPAALAAAANQTMRADWFVTSIPDSPVDAYFTFLGINTDDPTIDAMNNVNRFADMAAGAPLTLRAGFNVSVPEVHNRIVSWHRTTMFGSGPLGSGHLFKTYNMESDTGTANVFSHPYEPTTNNPNPPGPFDFEHGDSDNIFTLPNGLFGWYTTIAGDQMGKMQSMKQTGETFAGPTNCFTCHDDITAVLKVKDQVHDAILAAPAGTFPADLQSILLGMYDTDAFNAKIAEAGAQFAAAYAQLKMPVAEGPGDFTESMNIVKNNYAVVLDVSWAAAELGATPDQVVAAVKSSGTLALQLASLVTTDDKGAPNGVVRRDNWEQNYAAVRSILFPQLPAVAATP